jgi:beta-galactosidase
MDICGFPKASYWYYKANWTDEDVLNAWPVWRPGVTNIWVDSNCDSVEVFVNGKSVGKKTGDRLHHLSFPVVYEPGRLEVRGMRNGREVVFRSKTPAPAVRLRLTADRTELAADGADATVVNVQALDADGDEAPDSCDLVQFECTGAGKAIGVGNGNPLSHEDDICLDGHWKRRLFNGKAQLVVKAAETPGRFVVRARLVPTGETADVVLSVR